MPEAFTVDDVTYTVREAIARDDYYYQNIAQIIAPEFFDKEADDYTVDDTYTALDVESFVRFMVQLDTVQGDSPFPTDKNNPEAVIAAYEFLTATSEGIPYMRNIRRVVNALGE